MSKPRKWGRRLLRAGAILVVTLLVLWAGALGLMGIWVAKPPPLPPEAATALPTEQKADRVYVGRSWFGRREGLPVLYLTGTAYEMGYANGRLTEKLIHRQEQSVVDLVNRVAPNRAVQFLIKFLVVFKSRHLPEQILPEHQMEIAGLSRGASDPHPEIGPYYHRLLNYHGAQDISYMLMNSPLIHRGCTSFGAWGSKTRDGHLITGRNFDWEADPVFDEDRVLVICEPKEGIPFVSLSWAGMVGCVSGMNRQGVSISLNGAPSRLPKKMALPSCLVAREVLQHARNLAEATEIIRRRQVFVSTLFLVGSREDGRFIVVEKTPERVSVREAGQQDYLVCANHYLTPELESDELNASFKRVDTSVSRFDRLAELLGTATELDATKSAEVLRDRRLCGGTFPGNGHRGTLNPLIATHAVIMDLTAGVLWAAAPPHQLGRFVAFDVADPEKMMPEKTVPEDPMLASGEYQRYLTAQAKLSTGWQALKKGDYTLGASCAREAETNNPGLYRNSWLLAESLEGLGQLPAAAEARQTALAGKPAFENERARLSAVARKASPQTSAAKQ